MGKISLELRPVIVHGKRRRLFHRWTGRGDALIEMEEGHVLKLEPTDFRFLDTDWKQTDVSYFDRERHGREDANH